MNPLQRRLSKLEGSIRTGEQIDFVIHMIEPSTMRVTSRLRLIPGGVVEDDENGKAMETRTTELDEVS